MYFTIYKVTNLLDRMIYIGKHKTLDLKDKYLGSGNEIGLAIKQFGRENFTKEILHLCENKTEMNILEAKIVDKDFVARNDTYNRMRGGQGGWDGRNPDRNRPCSEEKKRKISAGNRGLKRTDETKALLSKIKTGTRFKCSKDSCIRQSIRQTGATYDKTCKVCGNQFVATGLNGKYCSQDCKPKYYHKRRRQNG